MQEYNTNLRRQTSTSNIRYYNISIEKNLFNEFIVERVYGNLRFQSYTGKRINCFNDLDSAINFFNQILKKKYAKGYA